METPIKAREVRSSAGSECNDRDRILGTLRFGSGYYDAIMRGAKVRE